MPPPPEESAEAAAGRSAQSARRPLEVLRDGPPARSGRDAVEAAPVVELVGISKRFGSRDAVRDLSLRVAPGTCFGLLGSNGAGKTTTLRMLYGVTQPTSGTVRVFGLDVAEHKREVRRRLGVTLQETVLIEQLSAEDNLRIFGGYYLLHGAELETRIAELMQLLELESHAGVPVTALSGGYQRRVAVAMSLIGRPELWILDEPTTGLDPAVRLALWSRIRALRDAGTTVMLTTHYMDEAERLCDRVAIMSHGRVVTEGEPKVLIREQLAREVVEADVDELEAARWAEACPGVRATLRADRRLMLFADDAGPVDAWVREQGGAERRSLVVRPANLEDVFLRVTGTRLDEEPS